MLLLLGLESSRCIAVIILEMMQFRVYKKIFLEVGPMCSTCVLGLSTIYWILFSLHSWLITVIWCTSFYANSLCVSPYYHFVLWIGRSQDLTFPKMVKALMFLWWVFCLLSLCSTSFAVEVKALQDLWNNLLFVLFFFLHYFINKSQCTFDTGTYKGPTFLFWYKQKCKDVSFKCFVFKIQNIYFLHMIL